VGLSLSLGSAMDGLSLSLYTVSKRTQRKPLHTFQQVIRTVEKGVLVRVDGIYDVGYDECAVRVAVCCAIHTDCIIVSVVRRVTSRALVIAECMTRDRVETFRHPHQDNNDTDRSCRRRHS